MSKAKAETLARIERAYTRLPDMERGLVEWKVRLYAMNLAAECAHRKDSAGKHWGISKDVAAKLFTVKHLAEALLARDRYALVHLLSIRAERLYAQALVKEFPALEQQWAVSLNELQELASLNYAELVK